VRRLNIDEDYQELETAASYVIDLLASRIYYRNWMSEHGLVSSDRDWTLLQRHSPKAWVNFEETFSFFTYLRKWFPSEYYSIQRQVGTLLQEGNVVVVVDDVQTFFHPDSELHLFPSTNRFAISSH